MKARQTEHINKFLAQKCDISGHSYRFHSDFGITLLEHIDKVYITTKTQFDGDTDLSKYERAILVQ